MTIAPIVQTVHTKAAPDRAFALFTGRMGDWWPKGKTIGANPHVAIVIEPHIDGRWYETDANGQEANWGKVLAWDPPLGCLLAWQLNSQWQYDPDCTTEVELTFAPAADGGTDVTLTHRNLERFGADADKQVASLSGGWPSLVAGFAQFADQA